MKGTEILIIIVIHLFILSLINEKFTNFLKLNLQSIYKSERDFWILKLFLWKKSWRTSLKNFLNRNLKNLREQELDPNKEKLRERGVINLTIICGIITATCAGADLFYMLKNANKGDAVLLLNWASFFKKLSWIHPLDNLKFIATAILNHGFGFVFSGLFLSLGSKFWHDLLDVLFEAKRLRNKLNNNELFASRSIEEVDEYINTDIPNLAIQQLSQKYDNEENILYYGPALRKIEGKTQEVILIYLKDEDDSQIPKMEKVTLPSARIVNIRTIVVKNMQMPIASSASGQELKFKYDNGEFATSCCILKPKSVRSKSRFLLTCNHFFTHKELINPNGWIEEPKIETKMENDLIGFWSFGMLDNNFDIALVELNENISLVNPILKSKSRPISDEDIHKKIIMVGAASDEKTGFIRGVLRGNLRIKYNERIHEIKDLIEIANSTSENHNSISRQGDSGALIYDALDKTPLGMIIAFNSRITYAISMDKILKELDMIVSPPNPN